MDLTPPSPLHTGDPTPEAAKFFETSNFLVVKLTDYCNLRCTYCHQDALNGKPVLMPMETFKNAVRMILKPSIAPVVNIQFHGGEPLLQPDEFFYEAVDFARKELETEDRKVEFFIQTNLTKVNPARQKMLQDLKIGISFSVDGPPHINDEMRGGGKIIFKNFKRLKGDGLDMGTICLIQPTNWDRMEEVTDYFRNEGLTNVRFNMMVPDGRGEDKATAGAEKLFNARRVILDQMFKYGDDAVVDSTLYNQMKRFLKPIGAPSSSEYHGCESFYCQAGMSLYSINPDGAFHACDRIAENMMWAMGTVNKEFGTPEMQRAQKKRSAFQHKDEWWSRCDSCDARKICEFSCSAYYVDKIDTREVECQQTKMMWDHFLGRKEEIKKFMSDRTQPLVIDDKKPLHDQREENWVVRDIAADSFYNEISNLETIAANREYRLVKKKDQFFLYLFKREKIFEVDALVAAIAKFNGAVPPQYIEEFLKDDFPTGKLRETLAAMHETVPEVFVNTKQALATQPLYHRQETNGESHADGPGAPS